MLSDDNKQRLKAFRSKLRVYRMGEADIEVGSVRYGKRVLDGAVEAGHHCSFGQTVSYRAMRRSTGLCKALVLAVGDLVHIALVARKDGAVSARSGARAKAQRRRRRRCTFRGLVCLPGDCWMKPWRRAAFR